MQKKSTVIISLAIFAAILIVVNMISSKLYFRLDFTDDQRYTLSRATNDVLTDLEDIVTVKAYFSEDLPAQLLSNRQDFEDLLIEYENRSGGNLVYEFISPNEEEEVEQEAQQSGIQPVIINVSEKDQVQQLKAYMGAVLMIGDQQEVIPVIQPGVDMEYGLTTAIKKLAVLDKPKVALIQGHGEPSMQEVAQLYQQLSVLYQFEPLDLNTAIDISTDYKSIVIMNPIDTIPQGHFNKIDQYLASGGSAYVAYSNVNGDLSVGQLSPSNDIGMTGWLASKGVNVGNQFVIDSQSGSVTVQQQQGFISYRSQVKFPYFPIVNSFPDHPVTKGLETIMLPFVSAITFSPSDTATSFTPLMTTSELSGIDFTPRLDIERQWTKNDFVQGPQNMAVAIEGHAVGSTNSKLIVVANGAFAVNGNPPQQINQDNVNFVSNSVDWLSDDTGLIDLRTKGITSRPLEQLEDGTREMLKYGNVAFPIVLVFIYAFIRRQLYLRKKQNWMEGKF
ncbi:GldG family protein [Reichenbachiella versicolor]|uniref:GldG family protein n=1 Tax=Reichenbachiella versicolor TaxID=1821036 RepID=UPI000D6E3C38|nr:Gldg family protein [Reichenbachiella versicolor]